jgi:hypothetical protein
MSGQGVTIAGGEAGAAEITVDAGLLAPLFDLEPQAVIARIREGSLISICERGIGADEGLMRLTFRHGTRRVRLIVDREGRLRWRSSVETRAPASGPASPRKEGNPR